MISVTEHFDFKYSNQFTLTFYSDNQEKSMLSAIKLVTFTTPLISVQFSTLFVHIPTLPTNINTSVQVYDMFYTICRLTRYTVHECNFINMNAGIKNNNINPNNNNDSTFRPDILLANSTKRKVFLIHSLYIYIFTL